MSDIHWRNSMKPVRFFFMDARAAWPFLLALLHLRVYTIIFAALTTMLFYFLEVRGMSFVAALRAFRVWIVTKKRPAVRHSEIPRMVDFAFEAIPDRFMNEPEPAAEGGPQSLKKPPTLQGAPKKAVE